MLGKKRTKIAPTRTLKFRTTTTEWWGHCRLVKWPTATVLRLRTISCLINDMCVRPNSEIIWWSRSQFLLKIMFVKKHSFIEILLIGRVAPCTHRRLFVSVRLFCCTAPDGVTVALFPAPVGAAVSSFWTQNDERENRQSRKSRLGPRQAERNILQ